MISNEHVLAVEAFSEAHALLSITDAVGLIGGVHSTGHVGASITTLSLSTLITKAMRVVTGLEHLVGKRRLGDLWSAFLALIQVYKPLV